MFVSLVLIVRVLVQCADEHEVYCWSSCVSFEAAWLVQPGFRYHECPFSFGDWSPAFLAIFLIVNTGNFDAVFTVCLTEHGVSCGSRTCGRGWTCPPFHYLLFQQKDSFLASHPCMTAKRIQSWFDDSINLQIMLTVSWLALTWMFSVPVFCLSVSRSLWCQERLGDEILCICEESAMLCGPSCRSVCRSSHLSYFHVFSDPGPLSAQDAQVVILVRPVCDLQFHHPMKTMQW